MAQSKWHAFAGPALTYDKYDLDTTLYYMKGGAFYRLDSTVSAGWSHKFMSAATGNIVMGVAASAIAKVSGA